MSYNYSHFNSIYYSDNERIGFFYNTVFDVSISDIFTTLLHSLTLVVIPEDVRLQPSLMINYLKSKNTTIL